MSDSDSHKNEPIEKPSAAEMEAAGQEAMFGAAEPKPSEKQAASSEKQAESSEKQAAPSEKGAATEGAAETDAQNQPAANQPDSSQNGSDQSTPDQKAAQETQESQSSQDPVEPSEQQNFQQRAAPQPSNQPYRVLARKYRPQTFSELIGQEPMVRTLANAIARDRLAHAFLMTGVRGVGKTSTARLIAKALNCIGSDGQGGPTIESCGICEPCVAIAEGRHIDVIEMDAASHTGVDDVREIIEAVRYAAVSARYKIYIIDEVHMLSRNAFNALLKTLEEPPAHVKFLFATTEVDKLPVTVLSRTQRFDLRRIPKELLEKQFADICASEGVEAEAAALSIIAAAAEGSSRDGLSILDQAIAHADLDGEGRVSAARVHDMLGLADKGAQRALLGHVLAGEGEALLRALEDQYALGVEPLSLMRGQMDLVHRITVAQIAASQADAVSEEEREALSQWAQSLSAGQLHRLWQLLSKGYEEVRYAPDPLISAKMALLRVLHANDLPDPGSLVKQLEGLALSGGPASGAGSSGAGSSGAGSSGVSNSGAAVSGSSIGAGLEALAIDASHGVQATGQMQGGAVGRGSGAGPSWAALVERIENSGIQGHLQLASQLKMQLRIVILEAGRITYSQAEFPTDLRGPLKQALLDITGEQWQVEKVTEGGAPTLVEQDEARAKAEREQMMNHPLVEATLAAFPDAKQVEEEAPSQSKRNWG